MKLPGVRVVIHVDFDYFFAQVEEREKPSIKGKPVVVCVYSGRGEDSGAVSTANYEARKYGVTSGLPIVFAKKRLRNVEATFLPVNRSSYDLVSRNIMSVLRSYTSKFEQVGVDEAFLDVTEAVSGDFNKAKMLGRKIKGEIFAKEKITCSVGIGPNKLVAKIAAGRQKPDGLTVVRPGEIQRFLSPLSVRELTGVGRKTERIMQKLRVRTIGELTSVDANILIGVFGRTLGTYFHNAAAGIDESPVKQKGRAESISRISTLKEDTRDLTVIIRKVSKLSEEVHSTVVNQGLSFKSIAVTAVMDGVTMRNRSKTFEKPTRSLEVINKTVKELLEQLLKEETERSVRRVGVRISNFVDEKGQKKLIEYLRDIDEN